MYTNKYLVSTVCYLNGTQAYIWVPKREAKYNTFSLKKLEANCATFAEATGCLISCIKSIFFSRW